MSNEQMIPFQERQRLQKQERVRRDEEIRRLYKAGFSMNQICEKVGVSKTTAFFAVNGRSKNKNNPKK